jgi:hypothetical protein
MRRALGALLVLLSACAGPAASITANPTPSDTATATVAPSVSKPSPSSPLPPELAGRWRINLGSAGSPDIVLLTLQDRSYRVVRGGFSGTGSIAVDGDTITFAHANQCDGDTGGRYRWTVANGTLTFTALGTDPCPRAGILDGKTYSLFPAG